MLYQRPLERLGLRVSAKLGRCGRCIRLAGRAALLSWAGVAVVWFAWPQVALVVAALVVAGALTLLLAAHVVAYSVRVVRLRRRVRVQVIPDAELEPLPLGRRQFLRLALQAAGGAFLFAVSARPAAAQQVTCPGTYTITLSGPNVCHRKSAAKPTGSAVHAACANLCASKNAGCPSGAICIFISDDETGCSTNRTDNADCASGKGWQTTCTYACVCDCH